MKRIKQILTFAISLIPSSRMKNLLLRSLGHKIHISAKLGSCLVLGTVQLSIGSHSVIRPFNVLRNLNFVTGENSIVGSWNWFSAAPALIKSKNYKGSFHLGKNGSINSRNYFDCSGGITFGDFTDLAGVRSTFITHYINTLNSTQVCLPIVVADYVMLSSNIKVTPGANVGSKSIVALGSVLINKNYPPGVLLAGVPAEVKNQRQGKWFSRKIGPVLEVEQGTTEASSLE